MTAELPNPQQRARQIGRDDLERRIRETMAEGALSHGWLITGPAGAGKATFAYRLARGLLDPDALRNAQNFDMDEAAAVFRLVAAGAHPDLFVAEREWDDKKARYKTEITVETIRKLTMFLNRTASAGGWRVAIVDTADDMNKNAANALLKILEEPPEKAALLLLSAAPGRLLATIRSRCRRIALPPLDKVEIENLLHANGVAGAEAASLTDISGGRPGYALRLAAEGGAEAVQLARNFVKTAAAGEDVAKHISALTGKDSDARWDTFKEAIVEMLSEGARENARGNPHAILASVSPQQLLEAWEQAVRLLAQGEGLNLDRGQLIRALGYDLSAIFSDRAA